MWVGSFWNFADFCRSLGCGDSFSRGPILRPVAAALAFPTRADQSHPSAGDHRVAAARICCTSTKTRRWPRDDRLPVPPWAPAPVHRSEPGRNFAGIQRAMELSECIGRARGLVSEANDEHEPCLPSGGGESDGRGSGIARSEWSGSSVGP